MRLKWNSVQRTWQNRATMWCIIEFWHAWCWLQCSATACKVTPNTLLFHLDNAKECVQDMAAAAPDMAVGSSKSRPLRMVILAGSVLALVAVAAILLSAGVSSGSGSDELMYGGPLSFDMVHTHILNMKMRRSRLKEKLKEAALKRKDREIAQEHGFGKGSMVCVPTVSFRAVSLFLCMHSAHCVTSPAHAF